jgi:ABC-type nitrate/sulfonate/bicarbonate transport system permease component
MTMLTASGISNVRSSYLDVARTLGAGRAYLIFRVALPAAMRAFSSVCHGAQRIVPDDSWSRRAWA